MFPGSRFWWLTPARLSQPECSSGGTEHIQPAFGCGRESCLLNRFGIKHPFLAIIVRKDGSIRSALPLVVPRGFLGACRCSQLGPGSLPGAGEQLVSHLRASGEDECSWRAPFCKEKGWRGDGGRFLGYPGYYLPVERIFLLVSCHRGSCNISNL